MFSIAQIKTEKLIFLLKTMFYNVKNIKANSNSQHIIYQIYTCGVYSMAYE